MSLLSALYTGVSGLQSFGDSLQVIGDNIANVNTVGFKTSRAEFADLLSQSISGGSGRSQLGRGVALNRVSQDYSQGSFSNTNRLTDLAINGNGFFMVNDGSRNFYTRNGQFTLNENGELINPQGFHVQGYSYDYVQGRFSTLPDDLALATSSTQPNPTGDGVSGKGITITMNLDQRTPVSTEVWDITTPAATSDFSTSITVYDIVGESHEVTVYFDKTGDKEWTWHAVTDSGNLFEQSAGTPVEGGSGVMTFTDSGAFENISNESFSFDFRGTADPQTMAIDFGQTIDGGNATGLGGTTQFASPNVVLEQSQDGFAAGSLATLTVNEDGVISGVYTNGRTLPIGQIALANFSNLQGLFKSGSGLYSETGESGVPVVGNPNTGAFGTVSAYTLELSNVDLANEFVSLISTQRAYQANSKIITVGDQLLSEIVNIIR